nr:transposase [Nocardioides szechwanensis]
MTTADVAGSSSDDGVMGPRANRPKRRSFSAEYKAQILAEYEAADRGVRGSILRREGLYSSHIIEWRRAAQAGAAAGLAPAARDRRERERDREVAQLRARAEKAEAELAKHKAALDLMGKAHALLETLSESADLAGPVAKVDERRSKR